MTETIQSTDLRRQVREILDRVRRKREAIVVQTYNTPQAVLIPFEEFEAYQAWQARRQKRDAWLSDLQALAEKISDSAALSDEEADAVIEEAKEATVDPGP